MYKNYNSRRAIWQNIIHNYSQLLKANYNVYHTYMHWFFLFALLRVYSKKLNTSTNSIDIFSTVLGKHKLDLILIEIVLPLWYLIMLKTNKCFAHKLEVRITEMIWNCATISAGGIQYNFLAFPIYWYL